MTIEEAAERSLDELAARAELAAGAVVVIGASTSEVAGAAIGTEPSLEVAVRLLDGLERAAGGRELVLAFQCCEHVNRALVVPRDLLEQNGLDEVSAFPVPGAGGALASAALLRHPERVLAETIRADAGLDIGQTMVGMHIKPVVKPVRLGVTRVGSAVVTAGYARPKLVGGQRVPRTRPEGLRLP